MTEDGSNFGENFGVVEMVFVLLECGVVVVKFG